MAIEEIDKPEAKFLWFAAVIAVVTAAVAARWCFLRLHEHQLLPSFWTELLKLDAVGVAATVAFVVRVPRALNTRQWRQIASVGLGVGFAVGLGVIFTCISQFAVTPAAGKTPWSPTLGFVLGGTAFVVATAALGAVAEALDKTNPEPAA